MLETGYKEEFCLAADFNPEFIARLMEAGFLVMSAEIMDSDGKPFYIVLPKLHLFRSVLFFDSLHIKKSIRRYLKRYELRPDTDFEFILDRCVEHYGNGWLTRPLVDSIKKIRTFASYGRSNTEPCKHSSTLTSFENADQFSQKTAPPPTISRVHPTSFALYRDGKLVAGEFGIIVGKVYTSYSGYYDENNAGTVQLVLTTQYLQNNGFAFFDLGMPLNYKTDLGAQDISPEKFVKLFRNE